MNNPVSGYAAVTIFLACTCSILGLTFFWALSNRRPVPRRPRVRGRRSAPYWYTTTGISDERGLTARTAARVAAGTVRDKIGKIVVRPATGRPGF